MVAVAACYSTADLLPLELESKMKHRHICTVYLYCLKEACISTGDNDFQSLNILACPIHEASKVSSFS